MAKKTRAQKRRLDAVVETIASVNCNELVSTIQFKIDVKMSEFMLFLLENSIKFNHLHELHFLLQNFCNFQTSKDNAISQKEDYLGTFQTKQCSVILVEPNFSKIRISCTAKSTEPGVKLSCYFHQEGLDTFSIKIKRRECDRMDESMASELVSNSEGKTV